VLTGPDRRVCKSDPNMQMTLHRFQSEQSDLGQPRQPYFLGGRTPGIYRRHANRARLAAQAAHKLDETGNFYSLTCGNGEGRRAKYSE